MKTQRGFTLLEMSIVVGVIAVMVMGAAFAFGAKPYALRSSAMLFDATVAHARSVAETSGNGATLVILPRGDGATLFLYRGRPNNPASMSAEGPSIELRVAIDGSSLGAPPWSFFFYGSGQVRATAGYPPLQNGVPSAFPPMAVAPACAVPGYSIELTSARSSEPRLVPCSNPAPAAPDTLGSP
ncbi:MAG: prepilin-type N-terminal cleavage/methylation domain-containing protein [Candidatus Eremiobacteraeota bacterium]|nr:prepilin-type N-terminal cleavage/methylation domain-containing protein [Candidatus Eremiobacteraeota bacterium]